jgi:hypothetical protein
MRSLQTEPLIPALPATWTEPHKLDRRFTVLLPLMELGSPNSAGRRAKSSSSSPSGSKSKHIATMKSLGLLHDLKVRPASQQPHSNGNGDLAHELQQLGETQGLTQALSSVCRTTLRMSSQSQRSKSESSSE